MNVMHPDWLDYPVSTPMSRRSVLLGMSVALFVAACGEQQSTAPPDIADPEPDPAFLNLSKALTGKDDLDEVTAARLSAAFRSLVPEVHGSFASLARLHENDPSALLAAAETHGLKAAALAIVAAWYTGSLSKAPRSATFTHTDALMQRPVADAMYPPTYASSGPGWWTAAPPAVSRGQRADRPQPPVARNNTGPER